MPNSFPPEFELDEKTVKLSLSIVSWKDDSEAKRLTKPLSESPASSSPSSMRYCEIDAHGSKSPLD
jgi:hypothetical protein